MVITVSFSLPWAEILLVWLMESNPYKHDKQIQASIFSD